MVYSIMGAAYCDWWSRSVTRLSVCKRLNGSRSCRDGDSWEQKERRIIVLDAGVGEEDAVMPIVPPRPYMPVPSHSPDGAVTFDAAIAK